MEEKERRKQEKMLEAERKRVERASRKKKLTRAELKEKAETDPAACLLYTSRLLREEISQQIPLHRLFLNG